MCFQLQIVHSSSITLQLSSVKLSHCLQRQPGFVTGVQVSEVIESSLLSEAYDLFMRGIQLKCLSLANLLSCTTCTVLVPMVSHSLHYFLIWHVQPSIRHSLTVEDKEMKKLLKVIVYTTVVVIVVYCFHSQSSRSHF